MMLDLYMPFLYSVGMERFLLSSLNAYIVKVIGTKCVFQEEEGWWEGNLNGKVGMFPSNFVVVLEPEEAEKLSNAIFLIWFLEFPLRKIQVGKTITNRFFINTMH